MEGIIFNEWWHWVAGLSGLLMVLVTGGSLVGNYVGSRISSKKDITTLTKDMLQVKNTNIPELYNRMVDKEDYKQDRIEMRTDVKEVKASVIRIDEKLDKHQQLIQASITTLTTEVIKLSKK